METDPTEGGCLKPGVKKLWKFVHNEDFVYETEVLKGRHFNGKWLSINDGTITIRGSQDKNRGYAWDGCTPKFNFLQITWGLFDGQLHVHEIKSTNTVAYKPRTYFASMVHDAIYQYKRCVPLTKAEADKIFYHQLKEAKWIWLKYIGLEWCFLAGFSEAGNIVKRISSEWHHRNKQYNLSFSRKWEP